MNNSPMEVLCFFILTFFYWCVYLLVIQTFRGTESDVIYPQVKKWLGNQLEDDAVATV